MLYYFNINFQDIKIRTQSDMADMANVNIVAGVQHAKWASEEDKGGDFTNVVNGTQQ